LIAVGLVLGTIIGVPLGRVAMTAVPQRTALSHAFGALCVTLVERRSFTCERRMCRTHDGRAVLEVILGALTFTGSLMAAGKLQEVLRQRPITYKGQNFVNLDCWRLPSALRWSGAASGKMYLFPFMIGIPLVFGV